MPFSLRTYGVIGGERERTSRAPGVLGFLIPGLPRRGLLGNKASGISDVFSEVFSGYALLCGGEGHCTLHSGTVTTHIPFPPPFVLALCRNVTRTRASIVVGVLGEPNSSHKGYPLAPDEGADRLYSPTFREEVFSETELPVSCALGNRVNRPLPDALAFP